MNRIFTIMLVVLFSSNVFAGRPMSNLSDFIEGVFNIAFAIFVLYILYKILESIGGKAKNKFDNTVVGMSLKVKKHKLKKELEEINKDKGNK